MRRYYTSDFSTEFRNQNAGQSPPVEEYLCRMHPDTVAFQYHYIRANNNPLGSKHLLDHARDKSQYSTSHAKYHPIIRSYLEKFGYYDIFLADLETGDIIYSVFKELDYTVSLKDGSISQTNFAKAFRLAAQANEKDAVIAVDFAQYWPSYMAPAGFVASPIFDGDKKVGVALFQFPINNLNTIMTERAGLGKTGETYLIGKDLLMRSDSFLDPENHNVLSSFKNPEKGKVDTEAGRLAVSGQTAAKVILDYNGNPVLSAFSPIRVMGLEWAVLAEIDVAEAFSPVNDKGEEFFKKYQESYGYYDIFLMNPNGHIFYTAAREADYQTNIVNGKYASSNLGKLTRKILKNKSFAMADFEPYAPSNGDPAAFIAQPVVHDGTVELVVALQVPMEAINGVMQQREGMGETGETYLVGPDKLMRSDSFLDPTGRTVKASFAGTVEKNGVDTEAAREAIAGMSGAKVITDYNGNLVLSAYTPVNLNDFSWALLAEIDLAEVKQPIGQLIQTIVGTALGIAIIVLVVAWLTSSTIATPLTKGGGVCPSYCQGGSLGKHHLQPKG